MSVMNVARPVVLMLALAAPAVAEPAQRVYEPSASTVSASDIQKLQDQVYDAGNEVSRLRTRDQATADRLQARLDDARNEVTYLSVKLRREGSVTRNDYDDVRGHIDSVRTDARVNHTDGRADRTDGYGDAQQGTSTWPAAGTTVDSRQSAPRRNEVPSGTEIDVRLERSLSSDTAQVEDRFTATTLADLYQDERVLIPAGSTLRGIVNSVNKASRTERKGSLTVSFDQISIDGRSYPIHGTVTQALESEGIKGEAGKIGAGAGVGAIIGGILGGAKGALLGILVGGGGTIAATDGKDVTLGPGTVLRVRMEQPLLVR